MYYTDINLLTEKARKEGIDIKNILANIGLSENQIRRRVISGEFLVGEMHALCNILNLTPQEAMQIFLCERF